MSWTQDDEVYGGAVVATIGADYRLRLPSWNGGCRFYDLTATTTGLKVKLPPASVLRPGPGVFTILNRAGNTLTITTQDGTTIGTVLASRIVDLHLLDTSTINGTWIIDVISSAPIIGSTLTLGREPFVVNITSGGAEQINLRRTLEGQGYTGEHPVAIHCEIAPGVVRGLFATTKPAIDSGSFPAGSTLLLVNRGQILGMGGFGGTGGGLSTDGFPGGDGGPALSLRLTTALINDGTIGGGGGGGGGGRGSSTRGGGGGGGGAGYLSGRPGVGGAGGGNSGDGGGTVFGGAPGDGGNAGGSGGVLGANGAAGAGTTGGAAGAAGDAIRKYGGITLTKIRTGTIYGSEVTA